MATPTALRAAATRTRSGTVLPLVALWGVWLLLMAGANLATPLYVVYARDFGFSSLVLTAIFATYAFVLVPALIVFGRLSQAVSSPATITGRGARLALRRAGAAGLAVGRIEWPRVPVSYLNCTSKPPRQDRQTTA
jgi:hypothetical protein